MNYRTVPGQVISNWNTPSLDISQVHGSIGLKAGTKKNLERVVPRYLIGT